MKCTTPRRGFLLVEVIASIGLILLLTGTLAWSMTQFAEHSDFVHARRRALAAAEATLNELRAGVSQESLAARHRTDDLRVVVEREPGKYAWRDFDRVTVSVTAPLPNGAELTERLRAYLGRAAP